MVLHLVLRKHNKRIVVSIFGTVTKIRVQTVQNCSIIDLQPSTTLFEAEDDSITLYRVYTKVSSPINNLKCSLKDFDEDLNKQWAVLLCLIDPEKSCVVKSRNIQNSFHLVRKINDKCRDSSRHFTPPLPCSDICTTRWKQQVPLRKEKKHFRPWEAYTWMMKRPDDGSEMSAPSIEGALISDAREKLVVMKK